MVFIPDTGTAFYIRAKPRKVEVVEGNMGDVKVKPLTKTDHSYFEDIFRCTARDDTCLVAERLTPGPTSYCAKIKLFRIEDFDFSPVGPGILKAMNITE